jgi:hypothetical protein
MLDGRNLRAVRLDCAAEAGIGHSTRVGAYVDRLREIDTAENDPGFDLRWAQSHGDLPACVQANAGRLDGGLDCPLFHGVKVSFPEGVGG